MDAVTQPHAQFTALLYDQLRRLNKVYRASVVNPSLSAAASDSASSRKVQRSEAETACWQSFCWHGQQALGMK
jgi:hypothetical protein